MFAPGPAIRSKSGVRIPMFFNWKTVRDYGPQAHNPTRLTSARMNVAYVVLCMCEDTLCLSRLCMRMTS